MKSNLNSIPIPTTLNIAISPHLTSPEGQPIDLHQGQPILTFTKTTHPDLHQDNPS